MPGINYDRLREEITMEEVLRLIAFEPTKQYGDQWYGRCPWHETRSRRRRTFSVNVEKGLYYCHECRRKGNQLQLWAEHIGLPLHPATIDLCGRLGRDAPGSTTRATPATRDQLSQGQREATVLPPALRPPC